MEEWGIHSQACKGVEEGTVNIMCYAPVLVRNSIHSNHLVIVEVCVCGVCGVCVWRGGRGRGGGIHTTERVGEAIADESACACMCVLAHCIQYVSWVDTPRLK